MKLEDKSKLIIKDIKSQKDLCILFDDIINTYKKLSSIDKDNIYLIFSLNPDGLHKLRCFPVFIR